MQGRLVDGRQNLAERPGPNGIPMGRRAQDVPADELPDVLRAPRGVLRLDPLVQELEQLAADAGDFDSVRGYEIISSSEPT